jgi:hypothetical protein
MKGDFSRISFDSTKHFTRVLQQQGRVQLDADWNEQTAIFLHYQQRLAADLIGPHGGPANQLDGEERMQQRSLGFDIVPSSDIDTRLSDLDENERNSLIQKTSNADESGGLAVGKGRYYVNGHLAEAEDFYTLYKQPDYQWPPGEKLKKGERYLIYLDVWEHHVTYIDDESIREVALEGADTTTRAKLVWQVKAELVDKSFGFDQPGDGFLNTLTPKFYPKNRGLLKAKAKYDGKAEPCISSPQASYRGLENQLYRVEIYGEGTKFSFKWSRDNASTLAAIDSQLGNLIKVDDARGFTAGQLIELTNSEQELRGRAGPLYKIKKIEGNEIFLDTEVVAAADLPAGEPWPTKARRWDGSLPLKESANEWQVLADGVQVQFQSAPDGTKHQYRTGDYWLIPVRTATGDVDWPHDATLPPYGINHHYAPLAIVDISADGKVSFIRELRKAFSPLAVDL